MPTNQPASERRSNLWWVAGWIPWILAIVILSQKTAKDFETRTVTTVYHMATERMLEGADLYEGGAYHYPPHFSALYYPFHAMGRPAGDIAWRVVGISCLAMGYFLMCRRLSRYDAGRFFFWATIISMPLCLSAMRNGQANTVFSGLLLLSAWSLSRSATWRASGLFALATGVKHLTLPMAMLGCVSNFKMIPRLIAVFAAWALLPFAFQSTRWVLDQYASFFGHAASLASGENAEAEVQAHRFADLNGIARAMGYEIPRAVFLGLATAAALGTAWYWWTRSRRLNEPARSLMLLAISVVYLMLFNPMNESNTYIIAAPAIALLAVSETLYRHSLVLRMALLASMFVAGLLPEALRRSVPDMQLWLKPTIAIFWAVSIVVLCERQAARDTPKEPA